MEKKSTNPKLVSNQIGCGYCKYEKDCKKREGAIRGQKEGYLGAVSTKELAETYTSFIHFSK
jgi:hypothetical protein